MADECIDALQMQTPLELYAFASPQVQRDVLQARRRQALRHVRLEPARSLHRERAQVRRRARARTPRLPTPRHPHRLHSARQSSGPIHAWRCRCFTWSRYAEISADRAGAHCAQDFEAVSRALFKLASGLSGKFIQFSLEDFLKQVDDMHVLDAEPGDGSPKEDWFSTHPFSPLRVKALQLFGRLIPRACGRCFRGRAGSRGTASDEPDGTQLHGRAHRDRRSHAPAAVSPAR